MMRKKKTFDLLLYINSFFCLVANGHLDVTNQKKLQFELSKFLTDNLPGYQIYCSSFHRHFFDVKNLAKHRIDIVLKNKINNELIAINLNVLNKGTMNDELFKCVQNIKYMEQLSDIGFNKTYCLCLSLNVDYCVGNRKDICKYFQKSKIIHGKIYRDKNIDDRYFEIKKRYKIKWIENNNDTYFYLLETKKGKKK